MAEKNIYVTHNYKPGAKISNLKLEDQSEPNSAVVGQIRFDSSTGQFYVYGGSQWEELTTATNTQTLDNKSISGGEFS